MQSPDRRHDHVVPRVLDGEVDVAQEAHAQAHVVFPPVPVDRKRGVGDGRVEKVVDDRHPDHGPDPVADGRLADATIEANKKNRTLESFLAGEGPQIEVVVKNVSIEDMRTLPYKATVDFERVYYNYGDGAELKREKYTAHFVFVVKDRVPNAMIPVNPLGLTITYFREDQAFQ